MSYKNCVLGILAAYMVTPTVHALTAGEAESGEKLHKKHCTACHDTKVYTREQRSIKSIEGLTGRVKLCNQQIGLKLQKSELDDIIAYLNKAFYKFD